MLGVAGIPYFVSAEKFTVLPDGFQIKTESPEKSATC